MEDNSTTIKFTVRTIIINKFFKRSSFSDDMRVRNQYLIKKRMISYRIIF